MSAGAASRLHADGDARVTDVCTRLHRVLIAEAEESAGAHALRLTLEEAVDEMLRQAAATGDHDRHGYAVCDLAADLPIQTAAGAVAVDIRQQQLACSGFHGAARPLQHRFPRVPALRPVQHRRRLPGTRSKIDRDDHAL